MLYICKTSHISLQVGKYNNLIPVMTSSENKNNENSLIENPDNAKAVVARIMKEADEQMNWYID